MKSLNLIELNLNISYTKEEFQKIIKDFNLVKKPLKNIKNASLIVFNQEILLAEKFQSLISKSSDTTRTKDLIDLYFIHVNSTKIDYGKFKKWVFYKWKKLNKNPLNQGEVIKAIRGNKKENLINIRENFDEAVKMYHGIDVDYEKAKELFLKLCDYF